jgi:steroid delta-isomerase-like uncharacterized protein
MSTVLVMSHIDMVREHVAAFTRQDWAAYKAHLLPDSTYEEMATSRRLTGPEEIVEGLKLWMTAFPDLRPTFTSIIESGHEVAAEITWEGTHTGPLALPSGVVPASGKRGVVHGAMIWLFVGDRVRHTRHYFELMELFGQLGVPADKAMAMAEPMAAAKQGAAPS